MLFSFVFTVINFRDIDYITPLIIQNIEILGI